MAKLKITFSDVFKKDLRVISFLASSWIVGLAIIFAQTGSLPKEGLLLGIIPALNYILFRILEELKKEGYIESLRNK
jgi:hypothetical protein